MKFALKCVVPLFAAIVSFKRDLSNNKSVCFCCKLDLLHESKIDFNIEKPRLKNQKCADRGHSLQYSKVSI